MHAIIIYRQSARRPLAFARGKSGQHRIRQSLTATGGNPRESATETIPPRKKSAIR